MTELARSPSSTATVHFIGAGPGAADLLTLRARDLIAASPVCLYAGTYVTPEILALCPPGARTVDTARMTLAEIVDEMVAAHRAGLDELRAEQDRHFYGSTPVGGVPDTAEEAMPLAATPEGR